MKSYTIDVEGTKFLISSINDAMSTPPSARGFSMSVFEPALNTYANYFKASEENGYAFIIYKDNTHKLIIKGTKGTDHKLDLLNKNKELLAVRESNKSVDDMEFLRRICLSGRTWPITINKKIYYFVALWNIEITPEQNAGLDEYLAKFPKDRVYILMGKLSGEKNSQFQPLSSFSPKIKKSEVPLSSKEKTFLSQSHEKNLGTFMPPEWRQKMQALHAIGENIKKSSSRNYII